ncbi:hypothetical protein FRC02_003645 [Tulasnella sp. 418]|nr:hypothetical protein FRC02_003645 [Tulasnella sp. 418]
MSLQFVHSHDSAQSHEDAIWDLKWTHRDQVVSISADGTAGLWNPKDGATIHTVNPDVLSLISLSVSPDGSLALLNSIKGTVILWDLGSGEIVSKKETYRQGNGAAGPAWSVSLNPKGGSFAASNSSGNVSISSADPSSFGEPLQTLSSGRTKFGMHVSYSPDGKRIALSNEAGAIYIFDVETGSLAQTYSSHAKAVRSVAWSPDSQLLLSASDDKRIVLHDVRTSAASGRRPASGAVASFNGHTSWVLSTAISSDMRVVASGSADRTIKLWDIGSRACVSTMQETNEVWGVSWVPAIGATVGAKAFATAGADGSVRFWRAAGTGNM